LEPWSAGPNISFVFQRKSGLIRTEGTKVKLRDRFGD
jgi:hypothetical protein